jgi:hypothetical protein
VRKLQSLWDLLSSLEGAVDALDEATVLEMGPEELEELVLFMDKLRWESDRLTALLHRVAGSAWVAPDHDKWIPQLLLERQRIRSDLAAKIRRKQMRVER